MKNLILVLLANAVIGAVALGQCVTNPAYVNEGFGIWPDTIDNLPCGLPNTYYETVIQFKMPTDFSQIDSVNWPSGAAPVNWIRLDNISGLPNGMSYVTDASSSSPSDQWNGGGQGCATIMGQAVAGTYPISINVTAEIEVFFTTQEIPMLFDGYILNIDPNVPLNTITTSACSSYSYGGNTYDSSGTYITFGSNPSGCDTIVTLNLTIIGGNAPVNNITASACGSYSYGGNTYDSSGTYITFGPNPSGCDTVITLDLTIYNIDLGVSNTWPILTANATNATYQWLDCDNNYTPIAGETSQVYIANSFTGNYAVEVTQNNCTDTSGCESVNTVGLTDNFRQVISIYPNPTTGVVTITGAEGISRIYDIYGRLVLTSNSNTLDISEAATGIYFVRVLDEQGKVYVAKVLKE